MAWAPPTALVWALAYGSVRVWWAVAGAPSFGPLGTDLIAFTGWWAVGLCAAAAVVTLGLWAAPWAGDAGRPGPDGVRGGRP
jgi:hypothetical protein